MKRHLLGVQTEGRHRGRRARSVSEDVQSAAPTPSERRTLACPPSSNTGGTVLTDRAERFARIATEEAISLVMTDTGELKQLMVRRPANEQCAFIDCLRFTLGEETWSKTAGRTLVSDDEYIFEASFHLEQILGYGITRHLRKPRDFYEDSWELGDGFGIVCFGGLSQRGTMLIVIHGTGCLAAREGWEQRLHQFLAETARRPALTRIDLAHDCFDGSYVTVDVADAWYDAGGFNCSYRAPSHEYRGNWKHPDGKGRSLYVGKRKNGKLCRVYEKGREQGDETSEWTRVEVEFRNTDRVIPFDVLSDPSPYFAGAYPCLAEISSAVTPTRLECKSKAASINVDACVGHIKRTYGKHIKVLRGLFGDVDLFEKIESDSDEWPARLKVADYRWSDTPIHRVDPFVAFNDLDISNDGFTPPEFGSSGGYGSLGCHPH